MKYCPQCQRQSPKSKRFCSYDGHILSFQDPYHFVGRTLFDKYRIDALIAIGGMGAVYSAFHITTDRRVAFKILQPNVALDDERVISLFEREAKLASQFFHENIALVFDAGRTADNIAYIVMEWLEGHTLEEELSRQGQVSLERTADILRQIAAALDTAHDANTIHRDLKPSNIMLTRRKDGFERVKVLDFGIGKILNEPHGAQVSLLAGTPHYASPEQFQLGARIDRRTDIYSLGVILYQMLTGVLPFNASSVQALVHLYQTASPTPISQLRPEVPPAIEQLIDRMLSKELDNRPKCAGEVGNLFERILRSPDAIPIELQSDKGVLLDTGNSELSTTQPSKVSVEEDDTGQKKTIRTVYKYPLPGRTVIDEEFTLDLPVGARVLCVQVQRGSPCIWALVDLPSRNTVPRHFLLSWTGFPITNSDSLSYIGTFQLEEGAVVFHLFERTGEKQ